MRKILQSIPKKILYALILLLLGVFGVISSSPGIAKAGGALLAAGFVTVFYYFVVYDDDSIRLREIIGRELERRLGVGAVPVYKKWDLSGYIDAIVHAEKRVDILQTFMPSAQAVHAAIEQNRVEGRNASVRILLSDITYGDPVAGTPLPAPAQRSQDITPINSGRAERPRENLTLYAHRVLDSVILLTETVDECRDVEIRVYQSTPYHTSYHIDDTVYFSPFTNGKLSHGGPCIKIDEESPLYNRLSDHFDELWESSNPIDINEFRAGIERLIEQTVLSKKDSDQ